MKFTSSIAQAIVVCVLSPLFTPAIAQGITSNGTLPVTLTALDDSSLTSTNSSATSVSSTAQASAQQGVVSSNAPAVAATSEATGRSSVLGQSTPAQGGAVTSVSMPTTFATRVAVTGGGSGDAQPNVPAPVMATTPTTPTAKTGLVPANADLPTKSNGPSPLVASSSMVTSPTPIAIGRFTTISAVPSSSAIINSNAPAPTPGPTATRTTAAVMTSNMPVLTSAPVTSQMITPGTSIVTASAPIASIVSSIMTNPAVQSAIVEVQTGNVTRTTVIDGHITHFVVAVTSTRTRWLSITETNTRTETSFATTTLNSTTTVQPFPMPTLIPMDHEAEVDFNFKPKIDKGIYDKSIPMPTHSCPRDAIVAVARFRHWKRSHPDREFDMRHPGIDKCCAVWKCTGHDNLKFLSCNRWERHGLRSKSSEFNRHHWDECDKWHHDNDAQYTFYMQNLHVFGMTDVDEHGNIAEGPRTGQCCPEDGPPIDFGPNVAVNIVS